MMIRAALALSLIALQTTDGPQIRHFRYERRITITQPASTGQTCVPLDATVMRNSASGLTDVRLYQGTTETPYALRIHTDPSTSEYAAPKILNLGTRGRTIVFDVQLSHPSYRTLEIQTPRHDFAALVTVTGSQSANATAATHIGSFTIFDLTSQGQSRSTTLQLPLSTYPYLHVEINGPLVASDIRGITVVDASIVPVVYHTVSDSTTMSRVGRRTFIRTRLGVRVPVERVELVPPQNSGDFSRDAAVTRTSGGGTPLELARGTVFRVHTTRDNRRIDQEHLTIDVPDVPAPDSGDVTWALAIENGDDAPLPMHDVRFSMRERRVCFDAVAHGEYVLRYGDSALKAPRYEYARLFRESDSSLSASLEPERMNTAFEPRPDGRPWSDRHASLLWVALGIVVLALGGVAARSVMKTAPEDTSL